ncbi:MAG: hypothetical protein O2955_04750 [Planctomycetota bacterium]|nr:hypothetical protein [Planctomycetota bacterium]MDA1211800.1 hypothetical protein [Planctomycetota bacterium]
MSLLEERLERIQESLQSINVHLENLRVSIASALQRGDDHETRLRFIERWQHKLTPILAILTFLVGAVFSHLLERAL